MSSLAFETDDMRPVRAWCTGSDVHVELADGRTVTAPLWWYPFLEGLSEAQLNEIELMYEGVWWPAADEGISVKSIFLGRKAPNAKKPQAAA